MTQRFPQDPRSYYSIAMVRAMQNNATEALPMLQKAFELAPQLRSNAVMEQAFAAFRGNPQFQQLVNPH